MRSKGAETFPSPGLTATLSSIRNGGEGRGEEVGSFIGSFTASRIASGSAGVPPAGSLVTRRRDGSAPRCVGIISILFLLAVFAEASVKAADDPTNKTFFLPKSPTAAAYVLNRLSNKELAEAPRSEFVYVALLQRPGLERKYRIEALEGLAKIRSTDPLTELLAGLTDLDKKGAASESVLRDLLPILLQSAPEALTAKRPALTKLASDSQLAFTRQMSYAAIITGDGNGDRAWQEVESNPKPFADLLRGIALIRDASLRASFYPKVEPLIQQSEPAEVCRAAMTALAALPGNEAKTFSTLASLVQSGTERATAIESLQKIPRKSWPAPQAESLVESLIAWLKSVPADQRTEPEVTSAFQFATDLTTLLPPEKAAAYGKLLRGLGVSVVVLRTIPEQMLYDKTLIVVEAGKPVEIVLINDDAMPHNLVITAPGALEEIGNAAEKMPPTPDAQGRLYVPDLPSILHATKMVDPGQQTKLSFTAPETPGDYPFVCTYPGHWRRMSGILAVVQDVEAYLATHAASAQPKITEWKVDDLVPALAKFDSGRNLARGKELFTKLACASCHKLGPEGAHFGPDLTSVFAQYHNEPKEVLRQIIEPSLVISNNYRNFQFELKDGDEVSGLIVKEDGDSLTVQSGASASLIQTIRKADIKSQQPQRSSIMPTGLLNQLSPEEILDLLAFVKSGGVIPAHQHQH
ncbi:MAG TPA: c-type cytochrome [Verrucomicrobiae bacterium]|nr:c-type cytochrome [Verrucomicrobiae bacterium]